MPAAFRLDGTAERGKQWKQGLHVNGDVQVQGFCMRTNGCVDASYISFIQINVATVEFDVAHIRKQGHSLGWAIQAVKNTWCVPLNVQIGQACHRWDVGVEITDMVQHPANLFQCSMRGLQIVYAFAYVMHLCCIVIRALF